MNWDILSTLYNNQENFPHMNLADNQLHPVQVLKIKYMKAELDDDDGFRLRCLPVLEGEQAPKVGECNALWVYQCNGQPLSYPWYKSLRYQRLGRETQAVQKSESKWAEYEQKEKAFYHLVRFQRNFQCFKYFMINLKEEYAVLLHKKSHGMEYISSDIADKNPIFNHICRFIKELQ